MVFSVVAISTHLQLSDVKQLPAFSSQDLPTNAGVSFNVLVFGDRHEMMWPAPRPYDAASEAEAVAWCQGRIHANWGGTEVLSALGAIYASPLPEGTTRQVSTLFQRMCQKAPHADLTGGYHAPAIVSVHSSHVHAV